jgi:hypothetical protein
MERLVIAQRYRGPENSGHGGYTSARVAAFVDADTVAVTLRIPPPLDTPLRVERDGLGVRVLDGDRVVAEAWPADLDVELPDAPTYAEATRLAAEQPDDPDHPFPTCFACGPARAEGDGLRLRPAPLGDGRVVAPWKPSAAERELVWSVLDCPGAYAVNPGGARGLSVLGRLTAHIDEIPAAGDECVVVAWPLGGEDRRLFAGTALFRDGQPLAYASAIWFLLDPVDSSA